MTPAVRAATRWVASSKSCADGSVSRIKNTYRYGYVRNDVWCYADRFNIRWVHINQNIEAGVFP